VQVASPAPPKKTSFLSNVASKVGLSVDVEPSCLVKSCQTVKLFNNDPRQGLEFVDKASTFAGVAGATKAVLGRAAAKLVGKLAARRVAQEAPATVRGGESAAARYGREMHRTFDFGPGFRREFTLPSGRRADAVNLRTREVVELKPNNPRAIALGRRQLDAYARELEELYPGTPFTQRLETYERP